MGIATDQHFMQHALEMAQRATDQGEVPVGAVLVKANTIIAEGWNQPISLHDPSAHAEMLAIRNAAQQLGNYRLPHTTLYVTLEPCPMCAGLIIHSRIQRVVFGAYDPKTGAAGSCFSLLQDARHNHRPELQGGVLQEPCSTLLKTFFKQRRQLLKGPLNKS